MTSIAGVVALGVLLSPPPPEAVRAAVDAVYADAGIQRELPGAREAGREVGAPRRIPATTPSRGPSAGARTAAGAASSVFLWGLVVVAVGAVVAVLARAALAARATRRVGPGPAVGKGGPPVPASSPVPAPGDVDALVAAGRFDAAVHALLLQALDALGAGSAALPSAWTSREALARAGLGGEGRAGLAALVEGVERSRFGGRALGRDDVDAARVACDAVRRAAATRRGAAA